MKNLKQNNMKKLILYIYPLLISAFCLYIAFTGFPSMSGSGKIINISFFIIGGLGIWVVIDNFLNNIKF